MDRPTLLTRDEVLSRIGDLGYSATGATPDDAQAAVISTYRDKMGLLPGTDIDDALVRTLTNRFCGNKDVLAITEDARVCAWRKPKNAAGEQEITYRITGELTGPNRTLLTRANIVECFGELYAEISSVVMLKFVYTEAAQADINIRVTRIDGRGGTLAQAELPCSSGVAPLFMEIDNGEIWLVALNNGHYMDLYRVGLHEALHNKGISHGPGGSLMAPTVSGIRNLQSWDKEQLLMRYPRRVAVVPPTPPAPTPTPGSPGGLTIFIPGAVLVK